MHSIFDIIRIPFAFVIKWVYSWSNSYFVAILLFAILIKIVLFPFSIKQQKNSQKQAALRPKENLIRKKYAGRNDRPTQMKMNQEIQDLYQKENFSPLGGCLPMLLSMLVLLAVYAIVRSPLTYMANLPAIEKDDAPNSAGAVYVFKAAAAEMVADETLSGYKLTDFVTVKDAADLDAALSAGAFSPNAETKVCTLIHNNRDTFVDHLLKTRYDRIIGETEAEKKDTINAAMNAIPNMVFLGLDMGETPSFTALGSKEATLGQKMLILIPIITLVTSYLGQALTRKFTYQPEVTSEQKNQTRMMNVFMPLMSVFISFMVPAALAIYWIIQNITSPIQQIILAKMYPIKEITPEEMKEAERLYGGKAEKKSAHTASNGKKKRSLVYDDDDGDTVEVPEPKQKIREKEETEDSIVDQAPLKDEEKE